MLSVLTICHFSFLSQFSLVGLKSKVQMASCSVTVGACLFFMCLCSAMALHIPEEKKVYIVYMGALPHSDHSSLMTTHHNMVQEVTGGSLGESLIRSYGRSFDGFAASLTEGQRDRIADMERVVSVFPTKNLKLQTTRSWDFMGLGENIKYNPGVESQTIIGVIDSGIWPESKSFNDEGFSSPPSKWKGVCQGGRNFTCNNKVIGARCYYMEKGECSARDTSGHGTHTASIAAGNRVRGADLYGLAKGTARGGVPLARIAAYTVCVFLRCPGHLTLAAFDDAIADGVDIITVSLGGKATRFEKDVIAIGAFHAAEKGILTVQSAGNSGPDYGSISSVAPWIMSVGASSIDRTFSTKIMLGNGKELVGRSINTFESNTTKFPLVKSCGSGESVKGKIIVCDNIEAKEGPHRGSVGQIYLKEEDDTYDISPFPTSILNENSFSSLLSYMKSNKNPEGIILKSKTVKKNGAPAVAPFSSQGPNTIVADILKPDITASGVNILAAFSPAITISWNVLERRRGAHYNLMSGTSMACPHVAGAAAYVKTIHPDWSPSIIKSALMTTVWAMNISETLKMNEFAYGSGHLNPSKAVDPGLAYETTRDDYMDLFCAMNYSAAQLGPIIGNGNFSCPKGSHIAVKDMNYPSMSTRIDSSSPSEITFTRTVTNVGEASSSYEAQVTFSGSKFKVVVEPKVLSFKSVGEKKSFAVKVTTAHIGKFASAALVWADRSHTVRSPIILYKA